jgi:hypothetical protein
MQHAEDVDRTASPLSVQYWKQQMKMTLNLVDFWHSLSGLITVKFKPKLL